MDSEEDQDNSDDIEEEDAKPSIWNELKWKIKMKLLDLIFGKNKPF